MPKYVPWDAQSKEFRSQDGIKFLKLEVGKTYRVRLVAKPLVYFQHWDPIPCRAPQPGEDGKVIDPLFMMGFEPKKRYSIWVFDRNDNNELKVMDFPFKLYEQFVNWKNTFNDEPGGPNGPDFTINLKRPGGDKLRTQYIAVHMDRSPFTKAECEAIEKGDLNRKLEGVRRDHSPEEIRQMLKDAGQENAQPKPKQYGARSPQPQSQPQPQAQGFQTQVQPQAQAQHREPDNAPRGTRGVASDGLEDF